MYVSACSSKSPCSILALPGMCTIPPNQSNMLLSFHQYLTSSTSCSLVQYPHELLASTWLLSKLLRPSPVHGGLCRICISFVWRTHPQCASGVQAQKRKPVDNASIRPSEPIITSQHIHQLFPATAPVNLTYPSRGAYLKFSPWFPYSAST